MTDPIRYRDLSFRHRVVWVVTAVFWCLLITAVFLAVNAALIYGAVRLVKLAWQ